MPVEERNNLQIPMFHHFFWPFLVEQLFQLLISYVDIYMLSHYSDQAVAAAGISNQLIVVAMMMFGFVNMGLTIILAKFSVQDDQKPAMNYISQALYLCTFLSLTLTVFFWTFGKLLLQAMNTPDNLLSDGLIFLKMIALGLLFQAIMMMIGTVLKCYGQARMSVRINLMVNILNILGNYLVLFTPWHCWGDGIAGVATTTTLVRFIGCVAISIFFLKYFWKMRANLKIWVKKDLLLNILRFGLPSAGEHVSYNFSQIIIVSFISILGSFALNARIYTQILTSISFSVMMAVAQSSQLIVGKDIGRNQINIAFSHSKKIIVRAMIVAFLMMIGMAIGSKFIARVFTSTPQIQGIIAQLLWMSIFLEPLRGGNVLLVSYLNVAGDVRYPVLINILVMWIITIPLSYFVGIHLGYGLVAIWMVQILDEAIRFGLMTHRWMSKKWIEKSLTI